MTAKEAIDEANATDPDDRVRRFQDICHARGSCRREALANDAGRWTWCPDCLTLYDDYGKPVNEFQGAPGIH